MQISQYHNIISKVHSVQTNIEIRMCITLAPWISKGGTLLDNLFHQILSSHWSKAKTCDQILGSDWRRGDTVKMVPPALKRVGPLFLKFYILKQWIFRASGNLWKVFNFGQTWESWSICWVLCREKDSQGTHFDQSCHRYRYWEIEASNYLSELPEPILTF